MRELQVALTSLNAAEKAAADMATADARAAAEAKASAGHVDCANFAQANFACSNPLFARFFRPFFNAGMRFDMRFNSVPRLRATELETRI
jgi:hypothetical protein